jgi:DNA-binding LacI/PurR family transcriptional regulator
MASIKEIAQHCNVSIATVSNILNGKGGASEETRNRVLDAAAKLHYTPNFMAKNLKQKSTKTIGIITEDLTVFNTPEIVDGINEYCEINSYHFLLGNLRLQKKYQYNDVPTPELINYIADEYQMMQAKQVDGIIYIARHCKPIHYIPSFISVPIVIAYGLSNSPNIPSVIFDDVKAAYIATQTLILNKCDNIGLITGAINSYHTQQRMIGFQKALFDNKMFFNPELVQVGDWSRASGYNAAKKLIDSGIKSIFVMNDVMAGGVYDYAHEIHKEIGKDISIIGFDNLELSTAYSPALSTMALPLFDIGHKSAEILINNIEHADISADNNSIKIQCNLIERESIRAPQNKP